jgi:heat shock protein 5
MEAIKETTEWLDSNAATANTEDFEEQKEKLSNVAYPITSKLYSGAGEGEDASGHDEL